MYVCRYLATIQLKEPQAVRNNIKMDLEAGSCMELTHGRLQ
jgi:hypothetical protein